MNRIPKRIWCSCQKYVFLSHLGYRPPLVCQFCWECASHTNDVICPNVTQVRAEPPAELFFRFFFRSIKQRQAQSYGGPQLSRQNRKPHGKNKNITGKSKTSRQKQNTSRQKQNTSRQNQKPHGKPKYFTAKTKQLWFWRGYLLSQYQETHSTVNEEKKGDVLTPVL